MGKPMSSRYGIRTVTSTISAKEFAKTMQSMGAVATEIDVSELNGFEVAKDIRESLRDFTLSRDKDHRPTHYVEREDGSKSWTKSVPRFVKNLPDGRTFMVDAFIPEGFTCDLVDGETGELVFDHRPVRAGEKLFKLPGRNDDPTAEVKGAVTYVPRVGCRLVSFNGKPVYRIATASTGSAWSEADKIRAEAMGTKLDDKTIADNKAAAIAELEKKLAELRAGS